MSRPRQNIELKARCRDLAPARAACARIGARLVGVLKQVDTYFNAAAGRLKLREIKGARAELIWYRRADEPTMRHSSYRLAPIDAPAPLHEALAAALGVRCIVRKRRELWLLDNVRIHLDEVEGLGFFIEFEAVMGDGADEILSRRLLSELHAALGLFEADHVSQSYSDMIAGATG